MKSFHAGRMFLAGAVCAGVAVFAPMLRAAGAPAATPGAAPSAAPVAAPNTAAPAANAAPATGAQATPTTPAAGRDKQAIIADLNSASAELRSLLTSAKFLSDGKLRAELAPKVIPALNKMIVLFDELAGVDPAAKAQSNGVKNQFYTMLAMFGDTKAEDALKVRAAATTPDAAIARASLYMVAWARAENDGAAQTKVLDDIEKSAKADPKDDALAAMVVQMVQQGPATPEIKERATKLLTATFTGPQAKAAAGQLAEEAKLKSVEGKPLVLAGVKNDGAQFTTADWKGKVILVDFWATWCGPCLGELPRVKKAYATFHDKGLEILGVSCDREAAKLNEFLAANKDMPWPQLFDASKPGWHELAKGFGINGIPTMFLIDKKGIVRTVEARENFEELIPKMLDEK